MSASHLRLGVTSGPVVSTIASQKVDDMIPVRGERSVWSVYFLPVFTKAWNYAGVGYRDYTSS